MKRLRTISSVHNLCWITGTFLVSRFLILRPAYRQLTELTDLQMAPEQLVLTHPGSALTALNQMSPEAWSLYRTIGLTAGVLDALLTSLLVLGWMFFLYNHFRPGRRIFSAVLYVPIIVLVCRLCMTLALITSSSSSHLSTGITISSVSGYVYLGIFGVMIGGALLLLLSHLGILRLHRSRVNIH